MSEHERSYEAFLQDAARTVHGWIVGDPSVVDRFREKAAVGGAADGFSGNWLPFVESFRTLCLSPTPQMKAIFEGFRQLTQVA